MNGIYDEMTVFASLGETIYEELASCCSENDRLELVGGALDRLKTQDDGVKISTDQMMYLMAGMESAAQRLGHREVTEYISRRLDEIIP